MTQAPPANPFEVDEETLERAVGHLVELVDAPSLSGHEGPAVDAAERIATQDLGLPALRMEVAPGRDNLLVGDPAPEVLLCTHLDTVPPHFGARRDELYVHGRGSADAKGIAVAMLHALAALRSAGKGAQVGCLLVVGEESDHAGARAACSTSLKPRDIVLGEPCGTQPAAGQKGLLKLRLSAAGTAGHSAYPELGLSAIHRLLDALGRLQARDLPADDLLGPTTVNIGRIQGGVAANVIAPEAEAEVLIRCAAPVDAVLSEIRARLAGRIRLQETSRAEPLEFHTAGLAPGAVVPFNTDAHYLRPLGARVSLFGPGDMRCAHGDGERLAIRDLAEGIAAYGRYVLRLGAP